jgi:hypothetical protein
MHSDYGRSAVHVRTSDRRGELLAVMEAVAPRFKCSVETLGLYVMVAAFWGLILFAAATYALP